MSIDITVDSASQFEAGEAQLNSSARLDDDTFVIAFADADDNNKGKVIVGTRSGYTVSISAGDVAQFLADEVSSVKVVALSASLFVICYKDINNNNKAMVIAGTVSGTTITLGSAVEAGDAVEGVTLCDLDATHFVVSYALNSATGGNSKIGAVATRTISLGAAQQFYASALDATLLSGKLDGTHIVVIFEPDASHAGRAKAAEVNIGGDSITFGAESAMYPSGRLYESLAVLDATHFVVAVYQSAATQMFIIGATVNASTEAITIGTRDADDDATYGIYLSVCAIDSSHFLVSCRDVGDGNQGKVISGSISGNIATFDAGSMTIFDTDATTYTAIARLTDSYFLIAFNETP